MVGDRRQDLVQHGQGGRARFLRIRGVAADDGHGFRHVRCVGGGGRPAALCEKRIAAARSFKVLPAWPRSRPAARKAATSRGGGGQSRDTVSVAPGTPGAYRRAAGRACVVRLRPVAIDPCGGMGGRQAAIVVWLCRCRDGVEPAARRRWRRCVILRWPRGSWQAEGCVRRGVRDAPGRVVGQGRLGRAAGRGGGRAPRGPGGRRSPPAVSVCAFGASVKATVDQAGSDPAVTGPAGSGRLLPRRRCRLWKAPRLAAAGGACWRW